MSVYIIIKKIIITTQIQVQSMKPTSYLLFILLMTTSSFANAQVISTPEIDTGSAAIGLGLLAGVTAWLTERRRKK